MALCRVDPQAPARTAAITLSRDEIDALLWHLKVIDHAYGCERSFLGVAPGVERTLEEARRKLTP